MSLELKLERDGKDQAWGFRLQGGSDVGCPLSILRVVVGSPADSVLKKGDVLTQLGGKDAATLTHQDAVDAFERACNAIAVQVKRDGNTVSAPIPVPVALQHVAPQLASLADTLQSPQVAALPRTTFVPKSSLPAAPTVSSKHGPDSTIQSQGVRTD